MPPRPTTSTRSSSNATAESTSELSTASRRPLLPSDSQVKASTDSSGCCANTSPMARRMIVSRKLECTAITLLDASPRDSRSPSINNNILNSDLYKALKDARPGGVERLLGRGQGALVLAESVVEQRARPLSRAQTQVAALASWRRL